MASIITHADQLNRRASAGSKRHWLALAVMASAALLAGCGDDDSTAEATLACDDSIKTAFKPDAQTSVLLVKEFKAGDAIALANTPATPAPPTAPADLCLVKVLVGPGNAGPADAPSTSAGIGIEIWLPTRAGWNNRIRAWGNGGWAGSSQTDLTRIGGGDGNDLYVTAAGRGYVVVTSDHGHTSSFSGIDGSFGLNPDATINTTLWKDFAERSLHEMAVKSKALVKLYYGKAHRYAYWDGYSTGGRQALKLAQVYPEDFDGILSGAPAINWTRFITNELYPQIAMLRELGAPLASAKLGAATSASIAACGGSSLGFLTDPYACRYDPTKDANALCAGTAGNAGVLGTNADVGSCLTLAEASVVNRIWYGQTSDGSVPDPASDNASGPYLMGSTQLWFGLTRGTDLGALAGSFPFPIATDQVAIEMQNPALGGPFLRNAVSNGANQWTGLDYAGLTLAAYQGLALQPQFSQINTDNPDLSAFNARKGKLLLYHGLADNLIAPQGSDNYYNRVASTMGGIAEVQKFFRYYHVPGLAHNGRLQAPANVPAPQNVLGRDEMFQALQAWVESGTVPTTLTVTSSDASVSMPLCVYPQKVTYAGSGSVTAAGSYSCQ
jgi:Tannase and feruloyl esterase